MNRRGFIQISSVALLPLLLGVFPKRDRKKSYEVKVLSNRVFGHKIREASNVDALDEVETDVVIVGGGVAGVAAAVSLTDHRFLLFEANDRLGGSSASGHWKDARFALGAHYELAYPKNFGTEVIDFLISLNIIRWNSDSELFEFIDQRYVINESDLEQCYHNQSPINDVLYGATGLDDFKGVLKPYSGNMLLPTRLIDQRFHHLNSQSFSSFLNDHMDVSSDLKRRIDYQMLDDWGGTSEEVSALAGIHYYTCRPYENKDVQLFSPPNGNSYFIEKMIGHINHLESIRTNSIVSRIEEFDDHLIVDVIDTEGRKTKVRAKSLIYAGQKHVLPYILSNNDIEGVKIPKYAPWVVLNIICRKGVQFEKWQTDIISDKIEFLGLVNSTKQHKTSASHDVFTVYYCFKSEDREKLILFEKEPDRLIQSTLELIEQETGIALEEFVDHVSVNIMGHAMPKALPGYLSLDDTPSVSSRIHLAGVDTGRLPLFYEACDSGIQAANCAKKNLTNETTV